MVKILRTPLQSYPDKSRRSLSFQNEHMSKFPASSNQPLNYDLALSPKITHLNFFPFTKSLVLQRQLYLYHTAHVMIFNFVTRTPPPIHKLKIITARVPINSYNHKYRNFFPLLRPHQKVKKGWGYLGIQIHLAQEKHNRINLHCSDPNFTLK